MARAQSSWLLGLVAGILLTAIIWFAFSQWPIHPTDRSNPIVFDRPNCLKAAFNATMCFANGTYLTNATFRYQNQTYPCGCNTPPENQTPLPSITAEPKWTDTATPSLKPVPAFSEHASWQYVLTGYTPDMLERIRNTPSDGLVLDAFESSPDSPFSLQQVTLFQKNHSTVLAYLSIGEAEDYRPYWKIQWNTTPPSWMGKLNPNWPANYKVKYWDPAWQQIVFQYVDQIVNQGFNGTYLDVVDAYEYWSDPLNGENDVLSKDDAAARMIQFISDIRTHARAKNPNFQVFVQNAQELVQYPGYLDAMDGIGREDTWYVGYDDRIPNSSLAKVQTPEVLQSILADLIKIRQAGKTVLVVDYFASSQKEESDDFAIQARKEGFYPYAADTRELNDTSSLQNAGRITTQIISSNP